jgi:hypothetical protein
MKVLTQMLVMDRRNSAALRSVPVITYRKVTPAEANAKEVLERSARTHTGRMSLPVR